MNQTDERIIETALRLFAEEGYHGTSIRRITAEAGANLGAVTYHFGSKRELYERVLVHCIGPLSERVVEAVGRGGSPLDRLDAVVEIFFEYLQERPQLPQLMLHELVAGREPPPSALSLMQGLLGAIGGVIREGQAAGELRAGDPRLMAVSVISQPLHLTVVTRLAAGMDASDAAQRRRLLEHASSFIREGLVRDEGGGT